MTDTEMFPARYSNQEAKLTRFLQRNETMCYAVSGGAGTTCGWLPTILLVSPEIPRRSLNIFMPVAYEWINNMQKV